MIAQRTADGKIRVPFAIAEGNLLAEGMHEIGPDHPDYAEWDAWLTALEANAPGGDSWRMAGAIDTGEMVAIGWDGGITECPPDALDWLIAAADEGLVDAADGTALAKWLTGQGFEPVT